jgi:hypothetical protein
MRLAVLIIIATFAWVCYAVYQTEVSRAEERYGLNVPIWRASDNPGVAPVARAREGLTATLTGCGDDPLCIEMEMFRAGYRWTKRGWQTAAK